MKLLSKLTLAVLLFTAFTASAQKFGYINSIELLQQMPEIKKADSLTQIYQKSLLDQDNVMNNEYQQKLADFTKNEKVWAEPVKEAKQQELIDLQNRIQKFEAGANDQINEKKQEYYAPILKKAEEAVKAVAKENGYSYIFDTSVGAVIYTPESDNIMALVKKKLGLK